MHTNADTPPSFEPHCINLVSVKDSKITNVSLYSSRAEITRAFKLVVHTGLNQVNISGLPNALDKDSLKVEGRGYATIHDVTTSFIPVPPMPHTSAQLEELLQNKGKTEKAIARCTLAINSLETYLKTLNVKDVGVSEVANIVKTYQTTGEELDNQLTALREELKQIDSRINVERASFYSPTDNQDLRMKVTIGVFADVEGEVDLKLVYAVHRAAWNALYDIRVEMQAKEKPVELIYKASISQSTGEDWTDVDLILETAEPTFGVGIPSLSPWTVSVYRPEEMQMKINAASRFAYAAQSMPARQPVCIIQCAEEDVSVESSSRIQHQEARVNSKGNITATFRVPGKISIPSDTATHSVTIVKLELEAKMRWVTIPKKEAKTHLNAKIKNASGYTLLSGQASIYVDGSFIARTDIPPVSPEESFDCPLGLDPSVRVTYHPLNKKTTRTGFYNKTTTQTHTQRITIFNTKTTAVGELKVTDQFPVSDDSIITVKRISPALVDVLKASTSGEIQAPEKVKVSSGVYAQWNGADEPDVNVESLGKDGKLDWVCSVPSQGKIDLFLQYDVVALPGTQITGM